MCKFCKIFSLIRYRQWKAGQLLHIFHNLFLQLGYFSEHSCIHGNQIAYVEMLEYIVYLRTSLSNVFPEVLFFTYKQFYTSNTVKVKLLSLSIPEEHKWHEHRKFQPSYNISCLVAVSSITPIL